MLVGPRRSLASHWSVGVIPLVDLQSQYRALKPQIDAAVLDVFASAQFVLGPAVSSFEKQFAAF